MVQYERVTAKIDIKVLNREIGKDNFSAENLSSMM